VVLTEPLPLGISLDVSDITCLASPAYDDGAISLTMTGGQVPYSFAWTGPSGYTSASQNISGLTTGAYSVTVQDDYGCIITADTVLNLPEPLTIDTVSSNYHGYSISCFGRSDGWLKVIPLTGTGPYAYLWSGPSGFSSTADSIYSLSEGTYIVQVTDKNMCTISDTIDLVSAGQISMTINKWPSNGGGFNINCAGAATGRVDLTPVNAAGTPGYIWSDGNGGASRSDLRAGTHEVIITDANGCSADTSLTLSEPDPLKISFSLTDPYCSDSPDGSIFAGVTGGEGGYTFSWSNGETSQEITGLTAGLYRVTVTDFNSCTVTDSLTLKPVNEICVGIPNAFSPNGDGINEYWDLSRITLYPQSEVIIMNRWGEVVWKSEKGYPDPWNGRDLKGKALPMDSYHYAIDLHNGEKPIVGHVTIVR
jgi:gliding motility-associated-like protein